MNKHFKRYGMFLFVIVYAIFGYFWNDYITEVRDTEFNKSFLKVEPCIEENNCTILCLPYEISDYLYSARGGPTPILGSGYFYDIVNSSNYTRENKSGSIFVNKHKYSFGQCHITYREDFDNVVKEISDNPKKKKKIFYLESISDKFQYFTKSRNRLNNIIESYTNRNADILCYSKTFRNGIPFDQDLGLSYIKLGKDVKFFSNSVEYLLTDNDTNETFNVMNCFAANRYHPGDLELVFNVLDKNDKSSLTELRTTKIYSSTYENALVPTVHDNLKVQYFKESK